MGEKGDVLEGTRLDERLHRPKLKSGLVEEDTRVYLRVLQGPDTGKIFDLSAGGCYVVGRNAGDIPLRDAKVSGKHAELKILGPGANFLVDLASTNGTFLNGARIDRRSLNAGDQIRVGDTLLQFSVVEGTLPLSPA